MSGRVVRKVLGKLEGPEIRLLEVAVLSIDSILVGYPHPYVKEKLETAKACIEAVLEEHDGGLTP